MIFILFLLALVPTAGFAARAEAPIPVVAVYCEALLASGNQGGPVFEEDEWQDLARRLAERRLLRPALSDSAAQKACMEAHAAEFQDAEFLLKGKALVNAAAAELREREARYDREWTEFIKRLRPSAERATADALSDAIAGIVP